MAEPINKRLVIAAVALIREAEMSLDFRSEFRRAIADLQLACSEAAMEHEEQAAASEARAAINKAMGVHS